MRPLPVPWRFAAAVTLLGIVGGAGFGLVRGLSFLPTLPFAILEGALVFGVPAAVVGLLLAAVWSLGSAVRRHSA